MSIFESLERHGLSEPKNVRKIMAPDFPLGRVIEVDQDLALAVTGQKEADPGSDFRLLPNDDLGAGLRTTCWAAECRLRNLDMVARFAALWSDELYLPPYFGVIEDETNDETAVRAWIVASIYGVLMVRPLIEAGIIRLAPSSFTLCTKHGTDFENSKREAGNAILNGMRAVMEEYGPRVDVTVETSYKPENCYLSITAPEALLAHQIGIVAPWNRFELPKRVRANALRNPRHPVALTPTAIKGSGILLHVMKAISDDIISQSVLCHALDTKYLTNRAADRTFLQGLEGEDSTAAWNDILFRFLSYQMPFFTALPIEEILKIRREEGEAFIVYRDTIKSVIKEHVSGRAPFRPSEAERIFKDIVQPKLNKMEQRLAVIRADYSKRIGRDLGELVVSVAVGLAAGTLSADLGAVFSALLAAVPTGDLLRAAAGRSMAPSELKGEDLYFLWRLNHSAKSVNRASKN